VTQNFTFLTTHVASRVVKYFVIVRYNESYAEAFTFIYIRRLDDINAQACTCDSLYSTDRSENHLWCFRAIILWNWVQFCFSV